MTTPTTGQVAPIASAPPRPTLPNTGFDPAGYLVWALLIGLFGLGLLVVGRRARVGRHG